MRIMKILVVLSIAVLASFGCTQKQKEGWKQRADKITGRSETSAPVAKATNANNAILSDRTHQFLNLQTVLVTRRRIADVIEIPAVTKPHPDHFVSIKAPISGWVKQLTVTPGSAVQKDEIVAIIENPQNIGQHLQMKSPMKGVVSERPVNNDEWADQGMDLMEIIDDTMLQGKMELYPGDQQRVKAGQPVEFSGKDWIAKGRIQFISPIGDPATGRMQAFADISNPKHHIGAGLPVTARITIGEKDGLVVPRSALLHEEDHFIVFVRNGRDFEKRLVRTGIRSGNMVEIVSGVTEGEKVVSKGAYQLKNVSFSGAPGDGQGED